MSDAKDPKRPVPYPARAQDRREDDTMPGSDVSSLKTARTMRPDWETPKLQKLDIMSEMTGNIAQNFNNLLTVILGNIDRLRDPALHGPAREETIRMIDDAAQRGTALADHLMSFAQVEQLTLKTVDLRELIEAGLPKWRTLLPPEIILDVRHEGALRPVTTDPVHLEAAMLNLVINARDAMPEGGALTIDLRSVAPGSAAGTALDDTHHVTLTVTDTGHGMSPEVFHSAFEPYFTSERRGKGPGLGLSGVCGFIRQSGGDMMLSSAPGHGTSVTLFLPLAHPAPCPDTHPHKRADADTHTILVVDDDPLVRAYVQTLLISLHHTVIIAASGEEALEILRGGRPVDLLFSDVQMHGGMNGYDLARAARALDPGLAVLMTSGHPGSDRTAPENLTLLRKPYRARALSEAVQSTIAAAQTPPASR